MVALLLGGGLVVAALVALRTPDEHRDDKALGHARTACDLTVRADEAARVDSSARYAAAALLLDEAMIRSARAAEQADEFVDLDEAVRAVHAAAHRGKGEPLHDALDTALAACRGSVDSDVS